MAAAPLGVQNPAYRVALFLISFHEMIGEEGKLAGMKDLGR